jgi:hypothetical protein
MVHKTATADAARPELVGQKLRQGGSLRFTTELIDARRKDIPKEKVAEEPAERQENPLQAIGIAKAHRSCHDEAAVGRCPGAEPNQPAVEFDFRKAMIRISCGMATGGNRRSEGRRERDEEHHLGCCDLRKHGTLLQE